MPGQLDTRFFVCCSNSICWVGPTRDTQAEAEAAWDMLMGDNNAVRKPIQMITTGDAVFVMCDDGQGFVSYSDDPKGALWHAWPPIPETKADK
jgi:hypothetical protein